MQPLEELEKHYEVEDPWRIRNNDEDIKRRDYILAICDMVLNRSRVDRALDIGAGEGWITQWLPALEKFGYEVSDKAAARFPLAVRRVIEPFGKYSLVLAAGCLYDHYDIDKFIRLINNHSQNIIVTCNLKHLESKRFSEIKGQQIFEAEFPYKPGDEQFTQKLRVFKYETPA